MPPQGASSERASPSIARLPQLGSSTRVFQGGQPVRPVGKVRPGAQVRTRRAPGLGCPHPVPGWVGRAASPCAIPPWCGWIRLRIRQGLPVAAQRAAPWILRDARPWCGARAVWCLVTGPLRARGRFMLEDRFAGPEARRDPTVRGGPRRCRTPFGGAPSDAEGRLGGDARPRLVLVRPPRPTRQRRLSLRRQVGNVRRRGSATRATAGRPGKRRRASCQPRRNTGPAWPPARCWSPAIVRAAALTRRCKTTPSSHPRPIPLRLDWSRGRSGTRTATAVSSVARWSASAPGLTDEYAPLWGRVSPLCGAFYADRTRCCRGTPPTAPVVGGA
jgi:hypothetical protein